MRRLAVKGVPAIPLLIQRALRAREGGLIYIYIYIYVYVYVYIYIYIYTYKFPLIARARRRSGRGDAGPEGEISGSGVQWIGVVLYSRLVYTVI